MKNVISFQKSHTINSKLSLFYVDDSLSLLEIMKYILEKDRNICVQTCNNPKHAFQFLIDQEFDIILSDYDMPEINGIDFFKHIRLKGITTPFILYSSYSRDEMISTDMEDTGFYYLQKWGPVREHAKKIHEIIDHLHLILSDESARIHSWVSPEKIS